MRIDSHHSYTERYPLEHLETILKRNRFDGSILVVTSFPAVVPDFVKGIIVQSDLSDLALLDEYQRHPRFRAICYAFGDEIPDGLIELERRGIALDAVASPSLIPRIVERFPNLRIVIDHLGQTGLDGNPDQWARDLEEAAQSPNVFCKLSSVARLTPSPRPFVQHALAVFSPRRLMFGSDWPACLPEITWKASLAAFTQAIGAQAIEVREELLGGTAERFYAL